MVKQRRQPPFRDIVDAVKSAPQAVAERMEPGICPDGTVLAPGGHRYSAAASDISPGDALEAAASGAVVAWDPCGCGGYCGLTWFDGQPV